MAVTTRNRTFVSLVLALRLQNPYNSTSRNIIIIRKNSKQPEIQAYFILFIFFSSLKKVEMLLYCESCALKSELINVQKFYYIVACLPEPRLLTDRINGHSFYKNKYLEKKATGCYEAIPNCFSKTLNNFFLSHL